VDLIVPDDRAKRRRWPWFVVLAFAVLMWIGASLVSYWGDPEAAFWRKVINDRHERAEVAREKADGEPVIFVGGGSSCSFSIHSDVLTEMTGLQAVNFGGSAGMGYRYLLDLATSHAKSGDIVILQLEPGILRGTEAALPSLAVKMGLMGNGRGAFKDELYEDPVMDKLKALKPGAKFLGVLAGKAMKSGPMYRYQIEERMQNGTLSVKVSVPNPDVENYRETKHWAEDEKVEEDLARVAQYAAERGVKVYFTLPWEAFQEAVLDAQRAEHAAYLDRIAERLPVLRDEMMGAVGDNSLFLDTGFHMTNEGGRLRTRAMARALKLELSQEK
jgi:hypothetical protein